MFDRDPLLTLLARYDGTMRHPDSGAVLSAPAFRAACEACAAHLADMDHAPVILRFGNGTTFPVVFFAALIAGANPLLMPEQATAAEVSRFGARIGARAILTDSVERLPEGAAPVSLGDEGIHRVDLTVTDPAPGLDGLRGVPLHPTSGTTADAKIALRPAYAAVEEARHYQATLGLTPGTQIVCPVPLCHAYGFGAGMILSMVSGADLTIVRGLQPRVLARMMAAPETGALTLTPAMLPMVARFAGKIETQPFVLSAGSPLPRATAMAFAERTGLLPAALYGTTETGGISINADGAVEGGVGAPMAGVQTRLDDAHGPAPLGIASSSMMAGYLGPEGIDRSAIADGWFNTGDLARLEAGRLHLFGRDADVINVLGRKVLSIEVEETIAALPGVERAKVYPGSGARGEEAVFAAVVAKGLDEMGIRAHCLDHLSPEKCPSQIVFMDALPSTPGGKVITRELPGFCTRPRE